jgi:hypothetical protein
MDQQDRYNCAMAPLKAVARIAASTPNMYEKLMPMIEELWETVQRTVGAASGMAASTL